MIIRDATLADVPQLVEMGQRFRAKTSYVGIVAENPAQMAQTATRLIEQPQSAVMVAESRTGALVAMIGLTCYVHHISGAWTAGEVFWWSESPGAGILLLRQAVSWAQSQRAVTLQMVQPVEEVRLGDLYARFGFRCIEAAWQLDLTAREAVA
jgi:predicted aconitase